MDSDYDPWSKLVRHCFTASSGTKLEIAMQIFLRVPVVRDFMRFFSYSKRIKNFGGKAFREVHRAI